MKDGFFTQVLNILMLTALSLLGIVARQAFAGATDGKINWYSLMVMCFTAPALGIIAGGFAQWVGVPSTAMMAIVALVGFMGPAFVLATGEKLRDLWLKKQGG